MALLVGRDGAGAGRAGDAGRDEADAIVGEVQQQRVEPAGHQPDVGVDERDEWRRRRAESGVAGDGRAGVGPQPEHAGAGDRAHRWLRGVVDGDHAGHAGAAAHDLGERRLAEHERRHDHRHVGRRVGDVVGRGWIAPASTQTLDEMVVGRRPRRRRCARRRRRRPASGGTAAAATHRSRRRCPPVAGSTSPASSSSPRRPYPIPSHPSVCVHPSATCADAAHRTLGQPPARRPGAVGRRASAGRAAGAGSSRRSWSPISGMVGGYAAGGRRRRSLREVPDSLAADGAVALIGTGRTAMAVLDHAAIALDDVVVDGCSGWSRHALRPGGGRDRGNRRRPRRAVPPGRSVGELGAAVAVDDEVDGWPDLVANSSASGRRRSCSTASGGGRARRVRASRPRRADRPARLGVGEVTSFTSADLAARGLSRRGRLRPRTTVRAGRRRRSRTGRSSPAPPSVRRCSCPDDSAVAPLAQGGEDAPGGGGWVERDEFVGGPLPAGVGQAADSVERAAGRRRQRTSPRPVRAHHVGGLDRTARARRPPRPAPCAPPARPAATPAAVGRRRPRPTAPPAARRRAPRGGRRRAASSPADRRAPTVDVDQPERLGGAELGGEERRHRPAATVGRHVAAHDPCRTGGDRRRSPRRPPRWPARRARRRARPRCAPTASASRRPVLGAGTADRHDRHARRRSPRPAGVRSRARPDRRRTRRPTARRRRRRPTSSRRRSRAPEHDPVAALRVRPRDRPLLVAHEVARAALEALLVVEEDPAVGRRHEQLGRAGDDALPRAAVAADRAVDDDVRPARGRRTGSSPSASSNADRPATRSMLAHPNVLHPARPSRSEVAAADAEALALAGRGCGAGPASGAGCRPGTSPRRRRRRAAGRGAGRGPTAPARAPGAACGGRAGRTSRASRRS